jgi:hypothetical protein
MAPFSRVGASSKPGAVQFDFAGELWSGVTWIEVAANTPGVPTAWLDNLRFSVSEPYDLALTALVLAWVAGAVRGRTKAARYKLLLDI